MAPVECRDADPLRPSTRGEGQREPAAAVACLGRPTYKQAVTECTGMTVDQRFVSARFPRASRYHPDWIAASVSGGANSLWMTEWLAEALQLKPGMRVLDLGCGRAASSIFLFREFGVQVWAT